MAVHLLSRTDPTGHGLGVADATDPVGQPLGEALAAQQGSVAALAQLEQRAARQDPRPTMLALLPAKLAARLLRASNPTVARRLLQPVLRDALAVVVMAAGGSTLLLTRPPPRVRQGSIGSE